MHCFAISNRPITNFYYYNLCIVCDAVTLFAFGIKMVLPEF